MLAAFLALPARAQTHYGGVPGVSSVKVDGTSTLHDWEMEGKMIGGSMEFGPDVKLDASLPDGKVAVKAHAIIPVLTIHSKAEHSPEIMDGLMQKALKADTFPRIEYTLTEMTSKGPHEAGKPLNFDATGNLVIAGATNQVSFPVTIDASDPAKIKVSATVPIKMTAYGVDPPAPNIGLGLMRCGDDVKIIIDWTLKKRG